MKIVILRSAVRDLAGGYQFYARQGEGLGEYFEESLLADIESLRLYAGIHRKVHDFHRLLSKRFPYAVYYEVFENQVRIRAVLDCRLNPPWTARRLKSKG